MYGFNPPSMPYGAPMGYGNSNMSQDPNQQSFVFKDTLKLIGESAAVIEGFRMIFSTFSGWLSANQSDKKKIDTVSTEILTDRRKFAFPRLVTKSMKNCLIYSLGIYLFYLLWREWKKHRLLRAKILLNKK